MITGTVERSPGGLFANGEGQATTEADYCWMTNKGTGTATAKANTGVLHYVQDDDVNKQQQTQRQKQIPAG